MKYRILSAVGLAALAIPQAAQAEIIISPRVSYYFDNALQRTSNADQLEIENETDELLALLREIDPQATLDSEFDGFGANNDQLGFPMAGLAATYVDGDFSVTLTGMYGKTDGRFRSTNTVAQAATLFGFDTTDITTVNSDLAVDAERFDIELTAQKRISEQFALIGGVRFESASNDIEGTQSLTQSTNLFDLIGALNFNEPDFQVFRGNTAITGSESFDLYSLRGGVAGFIPFGNNNSVFLNGMLHVSHRGKITSEAVGVLDATGETLDLTTVVGSETSIGPDIAVGVQLGLAENVSFDVRYRGSFYFPISGNNRFDDPRVAHGVNAGISFLF